MLEALFVEALFVEALLLPPLLALLPDDLEAAAFCPVLPFLLELLLLAALFLLVLLEAEAWEELLFLLEELAFFWVDELLFAEELLFLLEAVLFLLPVFFLPDASAMDQK